MERTGLENIFRVRIAPNERIHAVGSLPTVGRDVVEVNEEVTEEVTETVIEFTEETDEGERATDPMERLAEKYKGTGIRLGRDPHKAVESLADLVLAQRAEIKKMERDAKAGAEFRDALLEDMKAAVVRAYPQTEAEAQQARYERLMANGSIQDIRETIADLDARSKFVAGRQTAENPELEKKPDGDGGENVTPINAARKKTPARLVNV
jgi:hypothetical protein